MATNGHEASLIESLQRRAREIAAACTRCGRCVETCPTAGPAAVARDEPRLIVEAVLAILDGRGDPAGPGARWARTCAGSGRCIGACEAGLNPRLMLALARLRLAGAQPEAARHATGQQGFHAMSRAVKVLSRLQLPPDRLGSLTRAAHAGPEPGPDVVLYLGCNVLRTPHIALLCMDVLDRIGTAYRVVAGTANCCGIYQFRAGDTRTAARVGGNAVAGLASTGASRVLTWCPTCHIQLDEILLPSVKAGFALEHVISYIADRLDALRPHLVRPVQCRVALHEHPGLPGVTEGVVEILRAISGIHLVDLDQPRVGYMCTSLSPVPAYKQALQTATLWAAEAAGVDCLVGVYHACHRELCAHELRYPFRIVNFLELVGEAMGIERPDLYKRWKLMQDLSRVLAEIGGRIDAAGLDVDTVREVIATSVLGEQPLPVDHRAREPTRPIAPEK